MKLFHITLNSVDSVDHRFIPATFSRWIIIMWKELVLLMMVQDRYGAIMQRMKDKPDKGTISTLE